LIRAVLDTNIVISALLFEGPVQTVVSAWQRQGFVLLASQALVAEYVRVLHYPKFRLTTEEIRVLVADDLLPFITPVKVTKTPRVIRTDPADNHVLACAVAGRAQVIVSGDHHLLELTQYHTIPILSLREFLQRLQRPH